MKFFKKTLNKIIAIFITLHISTCIFVTSLTGFILAAGDINCYSQNVMDTINNLFLPYAEQAAEDFNTELNGDFYSFAINNYFNEHSNSNLGIRVSKNNFVYEMDSFDSSNIIYSKDYYYIKKNGESQQVSYAVHSTNFIHESFTITVDVSINSFYIYDDIYRTIYNIYTFIDDCKYIFIITGTISLLIISFCIVYLSLAYKDASAPELHIERGLDIIPPSIVILICCGIIILTGFSYNEIIVSIIKMRNLEIEVCHTLLLILFNIIMSLSGTLMIYNTTRLIAGRNFLNRLILVRTYNSLRTFGRGILVGIFATLLIITFIIIGYNTNILFSFIPILLILGLWIWFMIYIKDLDTTIDKYANGEWSVNDSHSPLIIENIYNNLNHIGDSMQTTLEQSIRDERTKTELITNVSHDIKTPLTSIINYTDLLGRDNLTDEEKKQYLGVLTKSSARMKKLLEDLIEASKASTGNMELHMMDCNIRTLLSQSIAEYNDIALLRNLKIVPAKGEDDIIIHTDSSKLFRVFDNVLSNACKYSIPGSRIYTYINTTGNYVSISFVNTSENEITISADELTERFVRGDLSRNTDGSGLGLAIAKSITELLGGSLHITIDGDQFKLTLSFSLQ